ncbi:SurA N-terminal domain-containing protein [Jiella marina]|uniref:SurA N-terminal domain-containing protein n=1 Tax=Jiella sp. LLJ827 TaxID=2917712 RepID=UPI002101346F|nr:SurA N-terminal domain-containing protein [Jiella sp. LLJ827]MCQ0988480.1 SurA N-terminal domain-containing protein [Jiella sp. LLJ827]
MLNMLRQSVSGWTAKILLGLLVLSFAVWGIGSGFQGGLSRTVMTAGETEVSPTEYAFAYSQAVNRISRQIGRQITTQEAETFGIEQGVVSQLVSGAVLDEQSRQLGLGVSDERLAQTIAEDPTFRDSSGNFSRQAFSNALRNARVNENDYIEQQNRVARRSQLVDAVARDAQTPAVFVTALGLYNGERRTVDYLTLQAPEPSAIADPSEEELQSYFDEHQSRYAAPEYRSIAYAELTPQAITDPSTVTEDQIAADYEARKATYTTPERRHVQQIVFQDREAAEAAKYALASGTSFEEVAADAGRSLADIDLGTVAKSAIPGSEVADAAFSLETNEVSDVVDGIFGPTIVRVLRVEPEGVQPLEEVQDNIRNELALANAAETVNSAYDVYEDARGGGATFQEAADRAGIPVKTVEAIDRQGNDAEGNPVADIPAQDDLLQAAFESEPGLDNLPVNVNPNGYVFFDVLSVDPARDRTLDEVRERVVADWKGEKAQEQLTARAEEYEQAIVGGQSMGDIAAEAGLEVQTANAITRTSGASELGREGVEAAFSGGVGAVATAPGREDGTRLVLTVREVAPPADPAANVSQAERQQMAGMLENDLYQTYVNVLQNEYPVSMNRSAMEQARALIR